MNRKVRDLQRLELWNPIDGAIPHLLVGKVGKFQQVGRRAFSLLELLVSMVILALLLVVLASTSDFLLNSWRTSGSQAQFYRDARAAMDLVARRVTQATLNPYWAYDDPQDPTRYLRHSDLRFLVAPAASLSISGKDLGPGSAVFFQAPMGRSSAEDRKRLVTLLNTCGFYLEQAEPEGIPVGSGSALPPTYRLMEVQAPSEEMTVFTTDDAATPDWVQDAVASNYDRPVAENIILFHVRPGEILADGAFEDLSGTGQIYNSGQHGSDPSQIPDPQPPTSNQLPPLLEITLVAVDELSARRMREAGFSMEGRFDGNQDFEDALEELERDLAADRYIYRVLQTRVSLPNSKWNG